MVRADVTRWLQAPPISGRLALLVGTLAMVIPSSVRFALNGVVSGCEFTPYLPFVLICAVLLRWWQAGLVAVAALPVLGGLLEGSRHFDSSCFQSAAAVFLASSAGMILFAVVVRSAVMALQKRGADEGLGGVVFSLERGEVWASWYGQSSPVLLGSQRKVSEMMKDFLAQEELGRRLNNLSGAARGSRG